LTKLEDYGISGTYGASIKSYLKERYQTFALKDKTNTINYSNWELVKHGLPQGSFLSPFIFLITHKRFAYSNSWKC